MTKLKAWAHLTFSSLGIALLTFSGCGGSGPDVVEVSGRLTRAGKPVPNLKVFFQPEVGRPSWGRADENGKFSLSYDDTRDGAKVGMHTVVVVYQPGSPAEEFGQVKVKHHADEQAILDKYGSGAKEPLKVEIKEATDDLEIKLD